MPDNLLLCALSGEPLSNDGENEVVITPSGYICSKSLLVTKLTENGHVDPFTSEALDEKDLISLARTKSDSIQSPRLSKHSSFSSLLKSMQEEHDALLLELFDTRKALQETRKELSQSLYQNDAAIRVISRFSMERDEARQKLASYAAEQPGNGHTEEELEKQPKKQKLDTEKMESEEKEKEVKIPPEDVQVMIDEWGILSDSRKKRKKSSDYATKEELMNFEELPKKLSLHKSNAKPGITSMKCNGNYICTAGRDKHVVVFDKIGDSIVTTLTGATKEISFIDILQRDSQVIVLTASLDKRIRLYTFDTTQKITRLTKPLSSLVLSDDSVEDISIHATGKYFLSITQNCIYFGTLNNGNLALLTSGSATDNEVKYTCAGLHPDGLIYTVGTSEGQIEIWDLRYFSKVNTLEDKSENQQERAITAISFSENGYHIASLSSVLNGDTTTISIWDLRKFKCVASVGSDISSNITYVNFDKSGKFLTYSTLSDGINIFNIKEQKVVKNIHLTTKVSLFQWGANSKWIVTASNDDKYIRFYSAELKDDKEK